MSYELHNGQHIFRKRLEHYLDLRLRGSCYAGLLHQRKQWSAEQGKLHRVSVRFVHPRIFNRLLFVRFSIHCFKDEQVNLRRGLDVLEDVLDFKQMLLQFDFLIPIHISK